MVKRRSIIARDLKTPKYRPRIVGNRKRRANKLACRGKVTD